MKIGHKKALTKLVTAAAAAMVAITGFSLWLTQADILGLPHLSLMLASSCVATLLVMSMLHSELQNLYVRLSDRGDEALEEARCDSLTGIGNRKLLLEELDLLCSAQKEDIAHALLLLDLNGFKKVNDTKGHQFGDELIQAVAARLVEGAPETTVARLGGDEFALIASCRNEDELERLCAKLMRQFDRPYALPSGRCSVGGSLGACMISNACSASDMLKRADIAMYRAKNSALPFCIFDDALAGEHRKRTELAEALQVSLKEAEGLSSEFQPIVAPDNKVVAAEALLRWELPGHGAVSTSDLISVAEEAQLIGACGEFMALEAIRAAKRLGRLPVCINVSALQLLDGKFARWFVEQMEEHVVAGEQFIVEVQEQDLVIRGHEMGESLDILKAAGARLAVDDFGSSIASLAHLHKLGASILKLSPDALHAAQAVSNIAVLRATVGLAKTLNMTVIGKGIESEDDRTTAIQAGCDLLQGYNIAEPDHIDHLLERSPSRVRAVA